MIRFVALLIAMLLVGCNTFQPAPTPMPIEATAQALMEHPAGMPSALREVSPRPAEKTRWWDRAKKYLLICADFYVTSLLEPNDMITSIDARYYTLALDSKSVVYPDTDDFTLMTADEVCEFAFTDSPGCGPSQAHVCIPVENVEIGVHVARWELFGTSGELKASFEWAFEIVSD